MIIVTGAAGFIGSCLVSKLNQEGFKDLILVDDFSNAEKMKNLEGKEYSKKIHRDEFMLLQLLHTGWVNWATKMMKRLFRS